MSVDAPGVSRLTTISLAALREYRQQLRDEEDRVSYWRRLFQGRLDMAAAGRLQGAPLQPHQIAAALGDGVRISNRLALLALDVGQPLPELPELARLWATPLTGDDDEPRVIAELAEAEAQLSTYRITLHGLLDDATTELIGRYRADPPACLIALPLGV